MAGGHRDDNDKLIDFLNEILDNGTKEVRSLRNKLSVSYWVIIVLSVIMFAAGLWLIIEPAMAAMEDGGSFGSAGWTKMSAGFLDLLALHLSRPINNIQKLMGDMAQMTLAINSFRYQVALRLLEMEIDKRPTIGEAAEHIRDSATASMWLIAQHFEKKLDDHKKPPGSV